jgi:hypothetical protein
MPELSNRGRERAGLWPELPNILGGSPEANRKLTARLPKFVERVFLEAVMRLGEEEAEALFKETLSKEYGKRKQGQRGNGKATHPLRDKTLLMAYDHALKTWPAKDHPKLKRIVAERLYEVFPDRGLGSTAGAVETRLRRLLKRRDERRVVRSGRPQTLLSIVED